MGMITSNLQQLGAGTTDGLVVQPALDSAGNAAKLAFFGGTPAARRAAAAQATSLLSTASSTAIDTQTKAAIIEIMNTLAAVNLWKGSA